MDVQEIYKSKIKSAEDCVKLIEKGDRIYIGSLANTPPDFLFALDEAYEELEDVRMVACCMMYDMEWFTDPKYKGHLDYTTFFLMPPWERTYWSEGMIGVNSVSFSNLPKYLNDVFKVNVLAVGASPMDEEGYLWWGPNAVATNSIMQPHCDKIIVQICQDNPKSGGDVGGEKIHISEVTAIIDEPFDYIAIPASEVSDTDRKIAEYIIPEVTDGCTIQLGIGGLANAIGYGLEEKKDLSVFTEMITESMHHLAQKGVITGHITGGFALGSMELCEFTADNPQVSLRPIHKVCDAKAISEIDDIVSVNTCLMVDLTGQVASEAIGTKLIACTGGSTDFTKGASWAKNGKSFMCLASTRVVNGETISNIVMSFPPSTPTTIPRTDVMYIVTEYGIADIYNKSIGDRVKALIAVAHPDFRDELTRQAKEAKFIFD